jgi:GntR family transcriptional regulator
MADGSLEPGYKQVADGLRRAIRAGNLRPGDRVPSIAELVKEYNATIGVVRRALDDLRTEGVIVTRQGMRAEVQKVPGEQKSHYELLVDRVTAMQEEMCRFDARLSALEQRDAETASRTTRRGAPRTAPTGRQGRRA